MRESRSTICGLGKRINFSKVATRLGKLGLIFCWLSAATWAHAAGLDSRPSNQSCLAGDPPTGGDVGVEIVEAFPKLRTKLGSGGNGPMALVQVPGDDSRWIVARRNGLIQSFANDPAADEVTGVLDLTALTGDPSGLGTFGLTDFVLHPNFGTNGQAFVIINVRTSTYPYKGYLYNFTSSDGGKSFKKPGRLLLTLDLFGIWHPFSDLVFGPDGYLYIGMGDAMVDDTNNNTRQECGPLGCVQDNNSLYGKVLRIDVDGDPPYQIPADNPFLENGRGEVYAKGFRMPWRMSFDRLTGELWLGDVGAHTWEEIDKVERGGNYGYGIMEANQCRKSPCEPSLFEPPIYAYSHDEGCAVIGGYVYRGRDIPGLYGNYVFSDSCNRVVTALKTNAWGNVSARKFTSFVRPSSFVEDPQGELLIISNTEGRLAKMVPRAGDSDTVTVPTKLSKTGCFDPANPRVAAKGLIPYNVNSALWSDGAKKRRWMAVPNGRKITVDSNGDFKFPRGTVLVKEFSLFGRQIETRLFKRHSDGAWRGYSYEWNDSSTDATLVVNGKTRKIGNQIWTYPSPAQCLSCHTDAANFSLGPEIAQLNSRMYYPATGRRANQLTTLDHIDLIKGGLPKRVGKLPKLTNPKKTRKPIEKRVRSYLHANCAGCHTADGPPTVALDFAYWVPTNDTGLCNARPTAGNLGRKRARILKPGRPKRSIISLRMHALDNNRMPPLGTVLTDPLGTDLIDAWIRSPGVCEAEGS